MSIENDKIKRNVLAIKTGKQGQILLDDAIEKCRLTVLAIKLGIHWHVLLDDSVRSQKSVFVRLKGQGTLFTINKIDDETPNVTDNKIDLKMQLWKLPEDELKKMLIDLPPWRIYNVVPFSYVLEKPQTFQFQIVPESIDENDLFLLRSIDEIDKLPEEKKQENSRFSKPHLGFIHYQIKNGIPKKDAWINFKSLASESKGEKQINIHGYSMVYLKRDIGDPENIVRFSHSVFTSSNDGELVKKNTFDKAYDRQS